MRSNLKRWYGVLTAVSLIVGFVAGSVPQVYAGDPNPGVIPPNAKPYGMTYGEWSARWWQWALSLPIDQNPYYDEGGNCSRGANGQLGPVWFLTGVLTASGTAVRNCTVPAGKALFFPIINVECSTLEKAPFHGDNEAELRTCAKGFRITVDAKSTKIDGVEVQGLKRYLVTSPLFTFTVPPNNVLLVDPGTGQSVSNGYYLMLAPMPVGMHKIEFVDSFPDFSFSLAITYNLTVAPRRP